MVTTPRISRSPAGASYLRFWISLIDNWVIIIKKNQQVVYIMTDCVKRNVRVEWLAGYKAEEKPKRIWVDQVCIDVLAIIDQWRTPESRFFKILGSDQITYTLKNPSDGWEWVLITHACMKKS